MEEDAVGGAMASNRCGRETGTGAGPRSALVIGEHWCKKIFAGQKRWELRGQRTTKRERVCIAAAGSSTLVGEVTIVDCLQVGWKEKGEQWQPWGAPENFVWKDENLEKHGVTSPATLEQYTKLYAWVFDDVQAYVEPVPYTHIPQVAARGSRCHRCR